MRLVPVLEVGVYCCIIAEESRVLAVRPMNVELEGGRIILRLCVVERSLCIGNNYIIYSKIITI